MSHENEYPGKTFVPGEYVGDHPENVVTIEMAMIDNSAREGVALVESAPSKDDQSHCGDIGLGEGWYGEIGDLGEGYNGGC